MKFTEDKLPHETSIPASFFNPEICCPSCLEPLPPTASECTACGVVLSQFKRLSIERRLKHTIPGLNHLSTFECENIEAEWRKVEANYYDTETHNQFLLLCYRIKALPFAAKMYAKRLETRPLDEISDVMKKRVLVLLQSTAPKQMRTRALPESATSKSLLRLFRFVLFLAGVVGVAGFFTARFFYVPGNSLGVGLFLTATSLGALWHLRNFDEF